jgi:AcrR family transcriptional regulator
VSHTTDRKVVTRLDPAVRRTQIVESAARLFEERDPQEVPFEEIADAAGVSRALVYNYFGDRGGLLAAVYLYHFDAVQAVVDDAVDPDATPEERIRASVRAYLTFAAEHPGAWRLLHVAHSNQHGSVAAAREKRMRDLAAAWGGTTEARIVTCAVVGALEAATVDWLRKPDDVDLDRLARVIHALLWRGIAGVAREPVAEPARSSR